MSHAHAWRIDPQGGRYSWGRCACGAERLFPNSEEDRGKSHEQAKKERLNAQRSARLKGRKHDS